MTACLTTQGLRVSILAVLLTPLLASLTEAQDLDKSGSGLLLESSVLKQRVQIVAVPPDRKAPQGENTFVLKTEGWRTLLLHEGVSISQEQWANALDLLKIEASRSAVFRVVYNYSTSGKTINKAAADNDFAGSQSFFILARFGVGTGGNRLLLSLIDGATGSTIAIADHLGASMQQAVRKALTELEETVALVAWRCRVVGQKKDTVIIDRGRLDGLRRGQKLVGYQMNAEGQKKADMNMELRIMQFGTRIGLYEITEEGEEFCQAKPVGKAPLLAPGDILELPSVKMPDRERDTRGRRAWDKIYNRSRDQ